MVAIVALFTPTCARYEQCKNPLFETHWAGKDDIQTLLSFPAVKANLHVCQAYNDRASCCHQTFEPEQRKYFEFWTSLLSEKLLRADAHRQSVTASMMTGSFPGEAHREQYLAVLGRYADVFDSERQRPCFENLLAYTAGVICFGCKPDWSQYIVLSDTGLDFEHAVRVRMARQVCLSLWATCQHFGTAVVVLGVALRDSAPARIATLPPEDLTMFASQQALCDWMHDHVALHPFRLPTKADQHVHIDLHGRRRLDLDTSANASAPQRRRLQGPRRELEVLSEGRHTGFDLSWRNPVEVSGAPLRFGRAVPLGVILRVLAIVVAAPVFRKDSA